HRCVRALHPRGADYLVDVSPLHRYRSDGIVPEFGHERGATAYADQQTRPEFIYRSGLQTVERASIARDYAEVPAPPGMVNSTAILPYRHGTSRLPRPANLSEGSAERREDQHRS